MIKFDQLNLLRKSAIIRAIFLPVSRINKGIFIRQNKFALDHSGFILGPTSTVDGNKRFFLMTLTHRKNIVSICNNISKIKKPNSISSLHDRIFVFSQDLEVFKKIDFVETLKDDIDYEAVYCHLNQNKNNFEYYDLEKKELIIDLAEKDDLTLDLVTNALDVVSNMIS